MDDMKIVKRVLLALIIIPIVIVIGIYIWFLYEASKTDNYSFDEEMKKELIYVAGINEAESFNPIMISYIDAVGPKYYNYYELEFEISKGDYEKNNLAYDKKTEYDALTDASMYEEKDNNTYTCFLKYTKPVNEEKYRILEKIYRKQRNIPLDESVPKSNTDDTNTVTDTNIVLKDSVNAPPTTKEFIEEYDKSVENLDVKYFVTDFNLYKPENGNKNLTNKEISEIAEIGFKESAKRIAGEGASNKETETIKLEEIIPNNYFAKKYAEKYAIYKDLKMNAYVVTRENEMGCGIKIYIDPRTGLIVGGEAYGD